MDKCSSTLNGETVEFMGQQFSNDSSLTMANKLSKKIEKTLNIIDKAPANMH